MLETSTKFYQEATKPSPHNGEYQDQVLNATKVLMEPAGISSIDGGSKKYSSWP
jgi:hypothetical protein